MSDGPPPDLGWSEADGGSFVSVRCARERAPAWWAAAGLVAMSIVIGWIFFLDPRQIARACGALLVVFGLHVVVRAFADHAARVVLRLDAAHLTVERPRLAAKRPVDVARVVAFVAASGARGDDARVLVHYVEARREDGEVQPVPQLALPSFAAAAYVAGRLTEALLRLRARAGTLDVDG